MNARLPTGRTLLLLLIPGLVVLDLANGLLRAGLRIEGLPVSPGEVGRSIMLVGSLLVMATQRGVYFRRLQHFFLLALVLGLAGPINSLLLSGNVAGLAFDLESLFKTLYAPALIILFTALLLRFDLQFIDVMRAIALWGGIAGVGLVMFKLLDIGAATYGEYASAHKGLFLAQNDLGLGLVIALAASSHLLFTNLQPRRFLVLGLTVAGMLTLGTRMATLGAFAVPLAVYAVHLPGRRTRRKLFAHVFAGLTAVVLLSVIATTQFRSISSQSYQLDKFASLASGQLTRVLLLGGAYSYVSGRGTVAHVIGDGALRYQVGVASQLPFKDGRALAEVDWMDLYGAQGIIFVTLIYAFYLLFLFRTRAISEREGPAARRTLVVMLGLFLLHATLAGHALASPLAAGLMAPALALAWIARRKAYPVRRRLSWATRPAREPAHAIESER